MSFEPRRHNMARVNEELGARVRDDIGPVPRECFNNSLRAMTHIARAGRKARLHLGKLLGYAPGSVARWEPIYVEGYAALSLAPIVTMHGWVELDGQIVECSTPGYSAYYPVRSYTREDVARLLRRDRGLPIMHRGPHARFGSSPECRSAERLCNLHECGVDYEVLERLHRNAEAHAGVEG